MAYRLVAVVDEILPDGTVRHGACPESVLTASERLEIMIWQGLITSAEVGQGFVTAAEVSCNEKTRYLMSRTTASVIFRA